MLTRVEIEGQIDPTNPFKCSSRAEPNKVDRQKLLPNQQPTNWNRFCDEVDVTLQNLSSLHGLKLINGVVFAIFFFEILVFHLIVQVFFREMYMKSFFTVGTIFVFLSTAIVLFGIYWKMAALMATTYKAVNEICAKFSEENVVKYELQDEWFGGCSKMHVRRRFLMVNTLANGVDVENQQGEDSNGVSYNQTQEYTTTTNQPSERFSSNPIASNAPPTTSDGDNKSSLFNELSSGIN
jgi:hypothetical protein